MGNLIKRDTSRITNFKGKNRFVDILVTYGFKSFGPSHSASNGYDLVVNEGRRACFYDNRLWGDERVEFRVMDYGKKDIIKDWIFGLKTVKQETRYGIFSIYFDSTGDITTEKIELLIKVAKEMQ